MKPGMCGSDGVYVRACARVCVRVGTRKCIIRRSFVGVFNFRYFLKQNRAFSNFYNLKPSYRRGV